VLQAPCFAASCSTKELDLLRLAMWLAVQKDVDFLVGNPIDCLQMVLIALLELMWTYLLRLAVELVAQKDVDFLVGNPIDCLRMVLVVL
jgi:hypothetical protein